MSERVVAVIPARLASTRLPGKVLRPIAGVPMLGWVYRAALACPQLDQLLIATDSREVVAYAGTHPLRHHRGRYRGEDLVAAEKILQRRGR